MGKRNLRHKNTRKKMHLKNKSHSKRKTTYKRHRLKTYKKKMCVHCRCKVCKCNTRHKHMHCGKKSRSHKLRGGGNFNLHNLIPQDIRTAWENIEHGFQSLGNKMSGIAPPQSPSVVKQSYLEYLRRPIPLRTNLQASNASASANVNNILESVNT